MKHRWLFLLIVFLLFLAVMSCRTGLLNESKSDKPAVDENLAKLCPLVPGANSNITHLVLIVQENHSFDNIFGNYCKAAPGSNPVCTTGPECCEAGPAHD